MNNVIKTLDQLAEPERIALFIRERNEVLRALDIEKFEAFWTRWDQPRPDNGWAASDVPLAMMHKARLHIPSFSPDEQAKSRTWLRKHNYTEDIGGTSPEQGRFR